MRRAIIGIVIIAVMLIAYSNPQAWCQQVQGGLYKQVFRIHIESANNVDFFIEDNVKKAIVPNSPYPYFVVTSETETTIGEKIQSETETKFEEQVRSDAAKNSITVFDVIFSLVQYAWVETNRYTSYIFPMTPVTIYSEIYSLDMVITVWSDKPFAQSPMPLWVMQIIKWAVQAVVYILIAYFVVQAIQACVQSLFVKKQTVTIYNPDGTIRETREEESPDWTSYILIIGVVAAALILLYILMPVIQDKLKGKRKKRN